MCSLLRECPHQRTLGSPGAMLTQAFCLASRDIHVALTPYLSHELICWAKPSVSSSRHCCHISDPESAPSHPTETSQLSHVLLTTRFLLHEIFSCLDFSQSPVCLNNLLPSFSPSVSNLWNNWETVQLTQMNFINIVQIIQDFWQKKWALETLIWIHNQLWWSCQMESHNDLLRGVVGQGRDAPEFFSDRPGEDRPLTDEAGMAAGSLLLTCLSLCRWAEAQPRQWESAVKHCALNYTRPGCWQAAQAAQQTRIAKQGLCYRPSSKLITRESLTSPSQQLLQGCFPFPFGGHWLPGQRTVTPPNISTQRGKIPRQD